MSNPSSSGCGGRTTLESHQGVILYLSVFAAKTGLSHKEELANHPDPPDPVQSAAEEHRLLKEPHKVHTKAAKSDSYNYPGFLRASSLGGGWKVNTTTKIESYHWYCLKTRQVHFD